MLSFDVVVVGARCAGAALARLTAAAGLRTLVIDKARFPSDTLSTHVLAAHGGELLDHWGLLDPILATGAPRRYEIEVTVGELSRVVPLPGDGPGTLAPLRTVLDKLLVDAARSAGAEVWEATHFVGLDQSEGRVTGVRCRRHDGLVATVGAGVVVGADGVNSAVAKAVGAAAYHERFSAVSGVYAYYEGTGIERFAAALAERGLALAFPTNDELVCVAAAGHDDDLAELVADGEIGLDRLLRRLAPAVAEGVRRGRRIGRRRLIRARTGRYHTAAGAGWALVGDAGHYLDPFTGQGMANAFLGAELLGRALVDGLGGATPLGQALDSYQGLRDELTLEIHEITHRLAAFDWDQSAGLEMFMAYRARAEELRQAVRRLVGAEAPAAVA